MKFHQVMALYEAGRLLYESSYEDDPAVGIAAGAIGGAMQGGILHGGRKLLKHAMKRGYFGKFGKNFEKGHQERKKRSKIYRAMMHPAGHYAALSTVGGIRGYRDVAAVNAGRNAVHNLIPKKHSYIDIGI